MIWKVWELGAGCGDGGGTGRLLWSRRDRDPLFAHLNPFGPSQYRLWCKSRDCARLWRLKRTPAMFCLHFRDTSLCNRGEQHSHCPHEGAGGGRTAALLEIHNGATQGIAGGEQARLTRLRFPLTYRGLIIVQAGSHGALVGGVVPGKYWQLREAVSKSGRVSGCLDAAQLSIGVWHGWRDELLRKPHVLRFVAQVGNAGCLTSGEKKSGREDEEDAVDDGKRKLQRERTREPFLRRATRCPVSSRIVA